MIRPSKPIHGNVLKPSRQDDIALATAVECSFLQLCQDYRRIRGADLVPPQILKGDMLRWRQMRVRHQQGDFRNTEAELKSCKAVAEWTVRVNADLRGQKPEKMDWR